MSEINYKAKYQELKLKYMNSVDAAFRLGYEQGMQDAQVQQAQEQAAQAQAMEQAQTDAQGQAPGEEGAPQEEAAASENPNGSELDQHIAQLESMLGKTEKDSDQYQQLKKSLDGIKAYKGVIDMRKAETTINAIGKALNKKPMSKQASYNLNDNAKKALSMQEKVVSDIMRKWESEESKAGSEIKNILNIEGLTTQG